MTTAPKCYDHKTRSEAPRLCATCTRIAVEFDIVSRAIDTLVLAGYQVREQEDGAFTDTRDTLLDLLFNLDDAFVITRRRDDDARESGWIRFVFGNGGYDVISDYTVNLEDVLAPINAYVDTLAP